MTIKLEKVPADVSEALRRKAAQEGKSLGEVAIEALAKGLGVNGGAKRDLNGIAGTMSEEDARVIEETVRWIDGRGA